MKHYCSCCGRQFVDIVWDKSILVSKYGAVVLGFSQFACHDCAEDLDENGMFPEDHAHCY